MSSPQPTPPTERELAILEVLWRRREATVREVYEELRDDLGIVQNTVQAFLRTMTEKGLVSYTSRGRSFVYSATVDPEPTRRRLLGRVLEGVYDGAIDRLVEGAVGLRPPSKDEIARIRALLDQVEPASAAGIDAATDDGRDDSANGEPSDAAEVDE